MDENEEMRNYLATGSTDQVGEVDEPTAEELSHDYQRSFEMQCQREADEVLTCDELPEWC